MTTYVLHGGASSKPHPSNDAFFEAFTQQVDKPEVSMLLALWSRNRDQWDRLFERDTAAIKAQATKPVRFDIATDPEDYFKKIASFDIFYVLGGKSELIEPLFSEMAGFKESLAGKVYIGNSMGAFMVSERYVLSMEDQDASEVHQGLGILPIQTLCHWEIEEKQEQKLALLSQDSDLPILTLNEAEFVTFYQ